MRGVALVALLVAAAAQATTMLRADLPELTASADAIVRGTVKSTASHWADDGRRIVTEVQVEVAETLKGAPPRLITVLQPGGQVGHLGQKVSGLAAFAPGEEVVVFLEAEGPSTFHVAGLAQGKFRIERSSDGTAAYAIPETTGDAVLIDPLTRQESRAAPPRTLSLEELRAAVKKAVAADEAAKKKGQP